MAINTHSDTMEVSLYLNRIQDPAIYAKANDIVEGFLKRKNEAGESKYVYSLTDYSDDTIISSNQYICLKVYKNRIHLISNFIYCDRYVSVFTEIVFDSTIKNVEHVEHYRCNVSFNKEVYESNIVLVGEFVKDSNGNLIYLTEDIYNPCDSDDYKTMCTRMKVLTDTLNNYYTQDHQIDKFVIQLKRFVCYRSLRIYLKIFIPSVNYSHYGFLMTSLKTNKKNVLEFEKKIDIDPESLDMYHQRMNDIKNDSSSKKKIPIRLNTSKKYKFKAVYITADVFELYYKESYVGIMSIQNVSDSVKYQSQKNDDIIVTCRYDPAREKWTPI